MIYIYIFQLEDAVVYLIYIHLQLYQYPGDDPPLGLGCALAILPSTRKAHPIHLRSR